MVSTISFFFPAKYTKIKWVLFNNQRKRVVDYPLTLRSLFNDVIRTCLRQGGTLFHMRLISPSQRICFLTGLLLTTFTMFQFLRFPLGPIIKRTCGIFTATYMYSKTEGLSHIHQLDQFLNRLLCVCVKFLSTASSDFLRQKLRSYHFRINFLLCQITVKSQFGSTQFLNKVILIRRSAFLKTGF